MVVIIKYLLYEPSTKALKKKTGFISDIPSTDRTATLPWIFYFLFTSSLRLWLRSQLIVTRVFILTPSLLPSIYLFTCLLIINTFLIINIYSLFIMTPHLVRTLGLCLLSEQSSNFRGPNKDPLGCPVCFLLWVLIFSSLLALCLFVRCEEQACGHSGGKKGWNELWD